MLLSYLLKMNVNLSVGISQGPIILVCTIEYIAILITVRSLLLRQSISLKMNIIFHILNLFPATTLSWPLLSLPFPPPSAYQTASFRKLSGCY